MAALSAFREALRAELQADLGIEMVAGMLEGGELRPRRTLGSVWVSAKEVGDPAMDEILEAKVRVFPAYQQQRNPEQPLDPTPLEDVAEAIQLSVGASRTTLGPWFVAWQRTEIDLEDQAVEVTFLGRQLQLAETVA